MADEKNSSHAADPADALPMSKPSPVLKIVGGLVALVVVGLIVVGLSGGDDDSKKAKAEKTEKAADAKKGMTKEELAERQAHLKRTQAALIAAAAEEADEKKKADASKAPSPASASAAKPSGRSPAPKPKAVKNKKKALKGLDSLGSDITSALE